jgi:glycosyltransferase involved in cell wall biosynthesis
MSTCKRLIVHIITSLEVGGAQAVLHSIVTGLAYDGNHIIIYFKPGPYVEIFQGAGVTCYHIKGLYIAHDPIFFVRLLKLVKKLKPDVIHSVLWSANVCGRLLGLVLRVPVVLSVHNMASHTGWLRTTFDCFSWRGFKYAVAVSPEVKNSLIAMHGAHAARTIVVIRNGIDVARAAQYVGNAPLITSMKNSFKNNMHDIFIFGSVGRLVPVKQYDLLLKAFALVVQKHAHVRLIIVGDGPLKAELIALAHTLGVAPQVFFVGQCDAYEYYPTFDCFVQSSSSEGISIALLEALSCGVPCVVTSATPSHPVIVDGINGVVVVGGELQLAKAMCVMAANEQLRVRYRNGALHTVRTQFCKNSMIKQYADIFKG